MYSASLQRAGVAVLLLGLSGCLSGPSASAPPAVDPQGAAAEAISAYDKDGDGRLSEAELVACPAILAVLKLYDSDGDRHVSQAEIDQRLQQLYSRKLSFVNVQCTVTSGGRPLPGAEVQFTPVSFLTESIQPASGITDETGTAKMGVAPEYLPENLRQMQMMQVGVYDVEIKQSSLTDGSSKQFGFEVDPTRRDGTTAHFKL